MKKSDLPQTKIPGAIGSIFDPRDAKTGKAIPTEGTCQCGSTDNRVIQEGNETIRRCNACDMIISSVRPG
jgi:hypothetical protein